MKKYREKRHLISHPAAKERKPGEVYLQDLFMAMLDLSAQLKLMEKRDSKNACTKALTRIRDLEAIIKNMKKRVKITRQAISKK